jgi:mannitol-specific phosphotransferase system IIBC component
MEERKDIDLKIHELGRFLNLLVIINITFFVASGLVVGLKYYFPLIALTLFILAKIIIIFPALNLYSRRL